MHEILIVLFMVIAAFFNAVMDTIDFKFNDSLFALAKEPLYTWLRSYASDKPTDGWLSWGLFSFTWDGWHFSKTAMLFFFFLTFGWTGYFGVFEWWIIGSTSLSFWITHELFFHCVLLIKKD